jgi:hypothetical protein
VDVIPTHIDVERDPIVGQLTDWLRNTIKGTPPPTYPAVGVVDKRPEEPVPPELRAMDANVWPHLQSAKLDVVCGKFMTYYNNAKNLTDEPLPSTLTPCGERLRQWRRLLSVSDELPYKDIVECLGWHDVVRDSGLVHCLTKALLHSQKVPPTAWSVKRRGINMWKCGICLGMMHIACTYVARIRRGGAPMDCVWTALQQL